MPKNVVQQRYVGMVTKPRSVPTEWVAIQDLKSFNLRWKADDENERKDVEKKAVARVADKMGRSTTAIRVVPVTGEEAEKHDAMVDANEASYRAKKSDRDAAHSTYRIGRGVTKLSFFPDGGVVYKN